MKKNFFTRQKSGRSVFVSYTISYLSLVLISCTLIGTVFFWFSVQRFRQTAVSDTEARLYTALEDFNTQLLTMRDIALSISQLDAFQPTLFRRNKYYEIEMLNYLRQYKQALLFSQDYFLIYHDNSIVFHSNGGTINFPAYSYYVLGNEDSDDLWAKLTNSGVMSVFSVGNDTNLLFAYTINTRSNFLKSANATLCFIVPREAVNKRLLHVAGSIDGSLSLYFNDTLVTPARALPSETDIYYASFFGELTLRLEKAPNSIFSAYSFFSTTSLVIIISLVLTLVLFAVYTAYRTYLPIKNIALKYRKDEPSSINTNELNHIDNVLDNLTQREVLTSKKLQDQLLILKNQLFRLMLSGSPLPDIQSQLELLGIQLNGPYYCVLSCRVYPVREEECLADSPGAGELLIYISDLSEDELRFYPLLEHDGTITVLTDMKRVDKQNDASELLSSLLEAKNYQVEIGRGQVYDSLHEMPASYMEALSDFPDIKVAIRESGRSFTASIDYKDGLCGFDPIMINRIISFIKEGNLDSARSCLVQFAEAMDNIPHSVLIRKYIFSETTAAFIRAGREMKYPLNEQQISMLLTVNDQTKFIASIEDILAFWGGEMQRDKEEENRDDALKIIRYIRENCTNYDLSLDSISEVFGISPTNLSRLVKEYAGENYRDYLISLRMEIAKRLLVEENASVAEACRSVGYANISHFIKIFHRVTGFTPAKYRDNYDSKVMAKGLTAENR